MSKMKRLSLNEKEIGTMIAILSEFHGYGYHELNKIFGSETIKRMIALDQKISNWYFPNVAGYVWDDDLNEWRNPAADYDE